jgi:hypothetical protein
LRYWKHCEAIRVRKQKRQRTNRKKAGLAKIKATLANLSAVAIQIERLFKRAARLLVPMYLAAKAAWKLFSGWQP